MKLKVEYENSDILLRFFQMQVWFCFLIPPSVYLYLILRISCGLKFFCWHENSCDLKNRSALKLVIHKAVELINMTQKQDRNKRCHFLCVNGKPMKLRSGNLLWLHWQTVKIAGSTYRDWLDGPEDKSSFIPAANLCEVILYKELLLM